MESATTRSLISRPPYKILHLVRHAQGIHNVALENKSESALSPTLLDPQLSQGGWQQVSKLRETANANGRFKDVELIITSPMLRTLQTGIGIFGKNVNIDVGNNHANCEITTPNSPPIVAIELCRERTGVNPCDKRSNISKYQPLFPIVDFSSVKNDEDIMWDPNTREPLTNVAQRGREFIEWLWTRQEKEIAIISHGIFLQQTLIAFGDEFDPIIKNDYLKRFANCEVRTVKITDKRVKMEPDLLTTNYHCGRIPRALEFSNDSTKENILGQKMPQLVVIPF